MKKRGIYTFMLVAIVFFVIMGLYFFVYDSQAARQVLYYGSRNNDVGILQRRLVDWGYYEGPIDYRFGVKTWRSVREFQARNGLRVDGIVGRETWAALGYNVAGATGQVSAGSSSPVFRNDDIELLARLVHAEARGEPYEGQVAVAAVLLNRVESPSFPNTLAGVIYQPLAFESVANGQFNLPPTNENRRAARSALNGWDPTYGSLFFWNPSKPVNSWIWSRDTVRKIGSHIFAY
ncbi:MAG: spore cortex-lytic enzyme [Bacillota bacterium]